MLNMHSVAEDLTTPAKIKYAAIDRFPVDGLEGTTIRAVAADAGVSPALVIHHFGSKAGLHRACDDHVVHSMMEMKRAALESGSHSQAGAISSLYQLAVPLLRYLAWTLGTGSETAARIFEEFVDETTEQLLGGKKTGLIGTVHGDPRRQAAVLVGMQLAGMVFHDHMSRVFDIDMLSAEGLMAAAPYTLQVFSGDLFNKNVIAETRLALSDLDPNQEADK
jgi:AcrR family transcriptional regulator